MKKFLYMFRMFGEMVEMVKEHKLFFMAPLLLVLVAVSALVYYVGPTVVITFIYAGV